MSNVQRTRPTYLHRFSWFILFDTFVVITSQQTPCIGCILRHGHLIRHDIEKKMMRIADGLVKDSVSAGLAYMAEVAHATGPALRGPAPLGKIICCACVNCGIASWIVFTTAILHRHNKLKPIRGNIRALVEFTNDADEVGWVRGSGKATEWLL